MPPRNPELPEGTDHIVNGAMSTGAGASASTGTSGGTAPSTFVGGGATGDDTGGTAAGSGAASAGGGSGGEGGASSGAPAVRQQLKEGAQSLKQKAGDRVRSVAEDGKSRATSALDDFSEMLNETASTIDERLGADYGQYARRASDAVSSLADTLRNREVDQIYEDARSYVRKSPGVALGIAAVVGFTLARMIKAGLPDENEGQDGGTGGTGGTGAAGGGTQTGA